MKRPYNQKRRAEQAAETRDRIVRAAIDLHGTIGPARTSLSMIAERAGVQRHTLYAHFPDERAMLMACSGHELERDPLPQAESWAELMPGPERLHAGLDAIYGWYDRNAAMTGGVLRDAEQHDPTREIAALRYGPVVGGWHAMLGEGLAARQQAMLHVMLGFFTWRAFRESELAHGDAVAMAVRAIDAA